MKHQRCCKAHTVLDLRACAFKDAPLPSSMCVENTPALKRVFKNYCKYALGQGRVYSNEGVPHMNAQQFHRLCQDAGFVEPEGCAHYVCVCRVYGLFGATSFFPGLFRQTPRFEKETLWCGHNGAWRWVLLCAYFANLALCNAWTCVVGFVKPEGKSCLQVSTAYKGRTCHMHGNFLLGQRKAIARVCRSAFRMGKGTCVKMHACCGDESSRSAFCMEKGTCVKEHACCGDESSRSVFCMEKGMCIKRHACVGDESSRSAFCT
eukprot:1157298-Pelagomonas_calceolata.AAC.23